MGQNYGSHVNMCSNLARTQIWASRIARSHFLHGHGFRSLKGEPGGWSRRRESNPHGTKYHWILSPARLPVPPLRSRIQNSTAPLCTQAGLTRGVRLSPFLFPSPPVLLLRFLSRVTAGVIIRRRSPRVR